MKHSQTKSAKIEILKSNNSINLKIQDYGKGFASQNEAIGFGLTSIEQRAKILGGNFIIDSKIGNGTTISIRLSI